MDEFDVWSQQPTHMHVAIRAPTSHVQPQPLASLPPYGAAEESTQLAPLTLEAYMHVHSALTRGSQTVQQTLPGDVSKFKVQELKQVCIPSEGRLD